MIGHLRAVHQIVHFVHQNNLALEIVRVPRKLIARLGVRQHFQLLGQKRLDLTLIVLVFSVQVVLGHVGVDRPGARHGLLLDLNLLRLPRHQHQNLDRRLPTNPRLVVKLLRDLVDDTRFARARTRHEQQPLQRTKRPDDVRNQLLVRRQLNGARHLPQFFTVVHVLRATHPVVAQHVLHKRLQLRTVQRRPRLQRHDVAPEQLRVLLLVLRHLRSLLGGNRLLAFQAFPPLPQLARLVQNGLERLVQLRILLLHIRLDRVDQRVRRQLARHRRVTQPAFQLYLERGDALTVPRLPLPFRHARHLRQLYLPLFYQLLNLVVNVSLPKVFLVGLQQVVQHVHVLRRLNVARNSFNLIVLLAVRQLVPLLLDHLVQLRRVYARVRYLIFQRVQLVIRPCVTKLHFEVSADLVTPRQYMVPFFIHKLLKAVP